MTLCMFDGSTLTGHETPHHPTCWSTTQKNTSVLRRWTCMPLDMWRCCVVGPAEVDMTQHVIMWLWNAMRMDLMDCSTPSSDLIECYAILLSVLYAHHWT